MSAASLNLLCDFDSADKDDNDEEVSSISASERFFLDSDRTVLSLVILSIGLNHDDGSMILDPNTAPWKTMNATTTKPKAKVLKAECIRRWRAFIQKDPAVSKECRAKEPSNKYWSREKVMKYLCDHPISAARDVAFLRAEILKRKDAAKEAEKEAATEKRLLLEMADKGAKKYKSWTGKYPYL